MNLERALQILDNYNKRREEFDRLADSLSCLFAGTGLQREIREITECVEEAHGYNMGAGWLPYEESTFSELALLISNIKHDARGQQYRTLADIPKHLQLQLDVDEENLSECLQALREECREAYDLISEPQEMLDEILESDSLEMAWSEIDEEFMNEASKAIVNRIFEHHHAQWKRYTALARELVHMANHLDDLDYDASLIRALLFD